MTWDNPFARRSSQPVVEQLFAEPAGDLNRPFVVVQRFFADQRQVPSGAPGQIVENDVTGRRSANFTLPDGSELYVNSRDLTRDQLVAFTVALTARPADMAAPGVDLPHTPIPRWCWRTRSSGR